MENKIREPSKYVKAIYDVWDNTVKNIFINATAGSGKTTLLLSLIKRVPSFKKIIFLAFNKSIQEELNGRVTYSKNVDIKTIHSMAYSVLRQGVYERFKLNENKTFALINKKIDLSFIDKKEGLNEQKKQKLKYSYLFELQSILNLCHLNLVDPSDREKTKALCEEYGYLVDELKLKNIIEANKIVEKYNRKKNHKEFMIDFTDMLYLTYTFIDQSKYPKYDCVFIDESQDLNPLQREVVMRLIGKGGRFCAVGDDFQAIYSFMGSNLESFNMLKNYKNTVSLPLSVSYRCSKSVINEAKKYDSSVEFAESAKEGIVRNGKLSEIKEGDILLCRNNYPLVLAYVELLKQGKKAHILGRDFSRSLIAIIDKVQEYKNRENKTIEEGYDFILNEKFQELKDKGILNPFNNKLYQSFKEKIDIIKELVLYFGSIEKTLSNLENVFSDSYGDGVKLMTIHKSKGLESKRVFILGFRELIPSKYAETELELYQEKCLQFVAVTRAKEELVYLPLSEVNID